MAALPMIAMIGAAGLQAAGTLQQGAAAKAAGDFEQKQHQRAAAEERASSQRDAIEKRKEADLAMSRQLAVAGASGAGVVNPSILDIYGETAQQGEYNAASAIFGGESRARGQIDQGNAARAKGNAAKKGSIFDAGGQLLGGIGKAYG